MLFYDTFPIAKNVLEDFQESAIEKSISKFKINAGHLY